MREEVKNLFIYDALSQDLPAADGISALTSFFYNGAYLIDNFKVNII